MIAVFGTQKQEWALKSHTENSCRPYQRNTNSMFDKKIPYQKDGPCRYGLEELLIKYKVDVAIWAHEHYYERFWPLNDYRVMNGSRSEPYTNPQVRHTYLMSRLQYMLVLSYFLLILFSSGPDPYYHWLCWM